MTLDDQIYKSQSLERSSTTPPKTPEHRTESRKIIHPWPEPDSDQENEYRWKRRKSPRTAKVQDFSLPLRQQALLLYAPKEKYVLVKDHPIPGLEGEREMLIKVHVIGLNPIDWKAPQLGYGLPPLPCVSGRDLAGRVIRTPAIRSRFRKGDIVMAISTDYRDSRKSAYQQYAIATDFNTCRLPKHLSVSDAAPLGVAFVAAALGLGICMGMDFRLTNGPRGPDLLRTIRAMPREARERLGKDTHGECFDGIPVEERVKAGDWIAIWGGSSSTGACAIQLAKLAGLRVIAILDLARSGERVLKHCADLLVDRRDPHRAVEIVKAITKGKLRFGLDTVGKESAKMLAQTMEDEDYVESDIDANSARHATRHLVGLTGLPEATPGIAHHSIPLKTFHEAPAVGAGLMVWLEKLLEQKLLFPPQIEVACGGLDMVNTELDRLRDGRACGSRIVVPLTSSAS